MPWRPISTVYKREPSAWPAVIAIVIILTVIGAAIG